MVIGLSFFIVVATQYLILRFELWRHIDKQNAEEAEEYLNWIQTKAIEASGGTAEPPAMNEVEKEISDIENKG